MEYTVQKLAKLAHVSSRTLRYYDEIGILKPARINSSGYRIYSEAEVDKLQQILFYRELGVELETISELMDSPTFNRVNVLREHRIKLLSKKEQLDLLINNVEKTIATIEGRSVMSDREKFEGFKQKMINENELKYGKEIREKYGDAVVKDSYDKLKSMSKEQYEAVEKLTNDVNEAIRVAFEDGNPAGSLAQRACELHKKWLENYWTNYSKEAHMGLVQMYVEDERFKAYYEKIAVGCAEFLRDAMNIYTGIK